eukprot:254073-Chlamydomonas_euryale.AAC.1
MCKPSAFSLSSPLPGRRAGARAGNDWLRQGKEGLARAVRGTTGSATCGCVGGSPCQPPPPRGVPLPRRPHPGAPCRLSQPPPPTECVRWRRAHGAAGDKVSILPAVHTQLPQLRGLGRQPVVAARCGPKAAATTAARMDGGLCGVRHPHRCARAGQGRRGRGGRKEEAGGVERQSSRDEGEPREGPAGWGGGGGGPLAQLG